MKIYSDLNIGAWVVHKVQIGFSIKKEMLWWWKGEYGYCRTWKISSLNWVFVLQRRTVKNSGKLPWTCVNPKDIYGGGRGRAYRSCWAAEARKRNLDLSGWCSGRRWSRGEDQRRRLGSGAGHRKVEEEEEEAEGERWKGPLALFIGERTDDRRENRGGRKMGI